MIDLLPTVDEAIFIGLVFLSAMGPGRMYGWITRAIGMRPG